MYTSTKYKKFTVAAEIELNKHILIYLSHRGIRNILLFDDKNLPTKLSSIDLYNLLEDKYEFKAHTIEYIKEHFNIEKEL